MVRRCFRTKWYDDVPGARSIRDLTTAMGTTAVWLGFLNLRNMFSFAMTSGLASDSDKF